MPNLTTVQPAFRVNETSKVGTGNSDAGAFLPADLSASVKQPLIMDSVTTLTNKADKQLANVYRQILLDFADGKSTLHPANKLISDISENSTFGKWRSLIHSILSSQDFTQWAAKNKVSLLHDITISPKDLCIVARVSGKPVHFPRADFSSFELLMKVAEAFSPTFDTTYNPSGAYTTEVARFYGKSVPVNNPANTLKERVRASAAELEDDTAFSDFSHDSVRSESELRLNQSVLAELNEKQKIIQLLETFPKDGSRQLSEFLENTNIDINAMPAPGQAPSDTGKETISLEKYINIQGWVLPSSADELNALLSALKISEPSSPRYGDFGGALSWPVPMANPRRLHIINLSRVSLPGASGLLGYLSNHRRWETHELRNPRRVIEQILQSPNAQALGKSLQDTVGGIATDTSASDYVLASIHEAFEPGLRRSRTAVGGFEIAQPGNRGLTASAVVKRLADHLLGATSGNGHSRVTRELAPIAAHLLLSKRFPEFLVKNIPDKVRYGSHEWMALSVAVAQVEAQSPGATSTMSYLEVLHRSDMLSLISVQQQVEQTAKLAALMDWGVANSITPLNPGDDYTQAQQQLVLTKFNKRTIEYLQATEFNSAPLPKRADIGAKNLYDALGFNDKANHPYLNSLISKLGIRGATIESYRKEHGEKAAFYAFINEKCIGAAFYNKDFPGPYSLLDLHASNRLFEPPPLGTFKRPNGGLKKNHWYITNYKIKYKDIFAKSTGFPDTVAQFSEEIKTHIDNLKASTKTTTKHLLSHLSADDFRFFDRGKIEFFREELIYEGIEGRNFLLRRQPDDNKPTVAKCTIDSEVRFFEINPQKGFVERRKDLENNFVVGHIQGKQVKPGADTDTVEVTSYRKLSTDLRHIIKIGDMAGLPDHPAHDSYDSPRTDAIANFVTDNIFTGIDKRLEAHAKGATTFETEVPSYIVILNILLDLIPLYSAIENFSQGNIGAGIGSLILDVAAIASCGVSMLAKCVGTGLKTLKILQVVGLAAISLLNPLDGIASAITGLGKGIIKVGKAGLNQVRKMRGVNFYDVAAAAKRYDASAIGTFKEGGVLLKGPAALVGDSWRGYNHVVRRAFGTGLDDFVPSMGRTSPAFGDWEIGPRIPTAKQKATKTHWEKTVKRFKFGSEKSDFEASYYMKNPPKIITDKLKNLTAMQVMEQAQRKDINAAAMGALARQYDNLAFKHGSKTATKFIDNIDPEFGTVFPMPQAAYLSSTAQISDGQCAALARTFATAVEQGKEKTLINNMFKAAARADTNEAREFMRTLSRLQNSTENNASFYAQKVGRQVTYQEMVGELSRSAVTRSIMIDSPGHAMAAGVLIDGSNKKYYFYDPNAGVAFFPTSEAMQKGLTKLFNDKTLPGQYRTYATTGKSLEFKIFDHDDGWIALSSTDKVSFNKLFNVDLPTSSSADTFMENLLNQRNALPGARPRVKTVEDIKNADFEVPAQIYRAHTAAGDSPATGLRRAAGTSTAGDDYLAAIIKHTARHGGSGGEVMSFSASKAKANSFSKQYSTPDNPVPVFTVDTTKDPAAFRTVPDIILKDGERLVQQGKVTKATLLQAADQIKNQELEVFYVKGDVPAQYTKI
ncbi:hypothetical protein [Pseudomonas poae]|uniref:hypothetical protein n=1 Tax=Pseudomonas poae TaxID=200451 RepID=UPI0030CDD779